MIVNSVVVNTIVNSLLYHTSFRTVLTEMNTLCSFQIRINLQCLKVRKPQPRHAQQRVDYLLKLMDKSENVAKVVRAASTANRKRKAPDDDKAKPSPVEEKVCRQVHRVFALKGVLLSETSREGASPPSSPSSPSLASPSGAC